MPNVLSPRELVSRPDMDKTVLHVYIIHTHLIERWLRAKIRTRPGASYLQIYVFEYK